MDFPLPQYLIDSMETLRKNGHEVYLVGGAVRDGLLGLKPSDFDLCTSASVAEIKAAFPNRNFIIPNGEKHGTVAMHFGHDVLEISTFRGEKEEKFCIENDLIHRDLTINAIAYDGQRIIDPWNGRGDLESHILRMPLSAKDRLEEDPLRGLRVLRFHALLDFAIEEETATQINAFAPKIALSAKERILRELRAILLSPDIGDLLLKFRPTFCALFPDLLPMVDYDQHTRWHAHDLYTHTVHVVSHVKPDFVLRLSALLHDIGKIPTRVIETFPDGSYCYHFPKHPSCSASMAEEVFSLYRLSHAETREALFLIREHDRVITPTKKSVNKVLAVIEANKAGDPLTVLGKLLDLQSADHGDHTILVPIPSGEILSIAKDIIDGESAFNLKSLAIKGGHVGNLGLHGPDIGKALGLALEAVIEGKVVNEKEALLDYIHQAMPLD